MRTKSIFTIILGLLLLTGTTLADGKTWHTDWQSASAESKETGKPILMDFTGSDWCGWCIRLKAEVFDTEAFRTWADKNVVLLEIDFPRGSEQPQSVVEQNRKLAQDYGVRGFPTIVFSNAKGEELGRYGYDRGGPSVWTSKAEKMLK